MASAWLILFIFMGYLIAFYQNQQQPQPRERFYFYPGALFVFAVWIAVGMRELVDRAQKLYKKANLSKTAGFAVLGLGLLFISLTTDQTTGCHGISPTICYRAASLTLFFLQTATMIPSPSGFCRTLKE